MENSLDTSVTSPIATVSTEEPLVTATTDALLTEVPTKEYVPDDNYTSNSSTLGENYNEQLLKTLNYTTGCKSGCCDKPTGTGVTLVLVQQMVNDILGYRFHAIQAQVDEILSKTQSANKTTEDLSNSVETKIQAIKQDLLQSINSKIAELTPDTSQVPDVVTQAINSAVDSIGLQSKLDALKNELTLLINTNASNTQEAERLVETAKQAILDGLPNMITTQLSAISTQIQGLHTKDGSQDTLINDLTSRLSTVETKNTQQDSAISEANAKAVEANTLATSMNGRLTALEDTNETTVYFSLKADVLDGSVADTGNGTVRNPYRNVMTFFKNQYKPNKRWLLLFIVQGISNNSLVSGGGLNTIEITQDIEIHSGGSITIRPMYHDNHNYTKSINKALERQADITLDDIRAYPWYNQSAYSALDLYSNPIMEQNVFKGNARFILHQGANLTLESVRLCIDVTSQHGVMAQDYLMSTLRKNVSSVPFYLVHSYGGSLNLLDCTHYSRYGIREYYAKLGLLYSHGTSPSCVTFRKCYYPDLTSRYPYLAMNCGDTIKVIDVNAFSPQENSLFSSVGVNWTESNKKRTYPKIQEALKNGMIRVAGSSFFTTAGGASYIHGLNMNFPVDTMG